MKLRYFSHSAFQITTNSNKIILIDPFLDGNPTSPVTSNEIFADYIILTHAHGDHLGDTIKIAQKSNSLVIAVNELANYVSGKGVKAHNMHIGGSYNFEFGKVKFTIAHHGSSTPEGYYAGEPAGILLTIDGITIYHTGDTALFYDMKLIGEMNKIDYMFAPIGDNFTMGIEDAVKSVEFVNPKCVIPIHYNTFSVINSDPQTFKSKVEENGYYAKVLNFGEEIQLQALWEK